MFGLGSSDPTETTARNSGVSPSTSSSWTRCLRPTYPSKPAALRRIRVIGVDGIRNLTLGLKALRMVDANVQRGRAAGHPAGKVVYRMSLIEPNQ